MTSGLSMMSKFLCLRGTTRSQRRAAHRIYVWLKWYDLLIKLQQTSPKVYMKAAILNLRNSVTMLKEAFSIHASTRFHVQPLSEDSTMPHPLAAALFSTCYKYRPSFAQVHVLWHSLRGYYVWNLDPKFSVILHWGKYACTISFKMPITSDAKAKNRKVTTRLSSEWKENSYNHCIWTRLTWCLLCNSKQSCKRAITLKKKACRNSNWSNAVGK